MNLQDQVTSLEISKKLKEFGAKQESLFWWHCRAEEYNGHPPTEWTLTNTKYKDSDFLPCISAFTVAELGEMLPETIKNNWRHKPTLHIEKDCDKSGWGWNVYYKGADGHCGSCIEDETLHSEWGITEADARGKMLIYLLENNLLTTPNN